MIAKLQPVGLRLKPSIRAHNGDDDDDDDGDVDDDGDDGDDCDDGYGDGDEDGGDGDNHNLYKLLNLIEFYYIY